MTMAKKYKVREGFVVHLGERNIHEGGAVLELEDEVAAQHAHKLEIYSAKKEAADKAAAEKAEAEKAEAEKAEAELNKSKGNSNESK
jgi:hypothetical protein